MYDGTRHRSLTNVGKVCLHVILKYSIIICIIAYHTYLLESLTLLSFYSLCLPSNPPSSLPNNSWCRYRNRYSRSRYARIYVELTALLMA